MNPTVATPGFEATSSPTTAPGPVTRLKAPGGRSASPIAPASATAHTLVVGAGARTTVFPLARAGARISPGIVYGQFHGLMTPATPRGTRYTNTRLPSVTDGGIRPSTRTASAAAISKYAISSSTSSNASARSGLPWSSASVRAISSRRPSIASATRRIARARSKAVSPDHAANASRAASTARRTSPRVPSGSVPITSPVEGEVASNVDPLSEPTHSPAMNIR